MYMYLWSFCKRLYSSSIVNQWFMRDALFLQNTRMMGSIPVTFAVLCTSLLLLGCNSHENKVLVFPYKCQFPSRLLNCTGINEALQVASSDTTLYLIVPGRYVLENFTVVRDLANISLIGIQQSNITITCSEGVGLAFVNITNLTIQHVTIEHCGMTGNNSERAVSAMNEIVTAFYQVPPSLHVAVFLAHIVNANLHQVTVKDTEGIGLLGTNIVGTVVFDGVSFSNNKYNSECILNLNATVLRGHYKEQIGGGAFLVYYDYHNSGMSYNTDLRIHTSTFVNNEDCSITGSVARRTQFSAALRSIGLTVGSGGGLSIVLTQMNYSVNVTIDSCLFEGNIGQYGGGAHVSRFVNTERSKLTFFNCTFTRNGMINVTNGGGLAVLANLFRPYEDPLESEYSSMRLDINISLSRFTENLAFLGGGVVSTIALSFADHHDTVMISYYNCTFGYNTATFGAAVYAIENNIATASLQSLPPGSRVEATNIHVHHNSLVNRIRRSRHSSGVIDIRYGHFTLYGYSSIDHNDGTALRARRSNIHIHGECKFIQNVGSFGGALSLIAYSFLVIHVNTSVLFLDNYSTYRGGVFHVQLEDDPINYQIYNCFIYLNSSDRFCFNNPEVCHVEDITDLGINITIAGNKAPYGGLVYGSTLETCNWGYQLIGRENYTGNFVTFLSESEQARHIFHFGNNQIGEGSVTTPSMELNIAERLYSAMPGETFNVSMNSTDQLSRLVPTTVSSTVLPLNLAEGMNLTIEESILGTSNYWVLRDDRPSSFVPLKVRGNVGQQVRVTIFTIDSAADIEIEVNLVACVPGLRFSTEERVCICRPEIERGGIDCSSETYQLTVPNHVWIGLLDSIDRTSDTADLVIESCALNYCNPGEKLIEAGDFDAQCAEGYHRTGLLCGSCMEGYSVVLGTNRCKRCHNNAFLALILVFAVAGILLIALIAFLKVSVSEGYLNGILFYSHNLSQFTLDLAPQAPAIFLPVVFVNLDFGIETCFYEGMNALEYVGLQFVFPLYLYFLMAMIVLVARFKWPQNNIFSAGKTFATLLVVSYSSILRTCTQVLQHVIVHSITTKISSVRWLIDPQVKYFHSLHAVLAVFSILLLVLYLIPLPLILLFPAKAYSWKYTGKTKPILDAFFAPYKPKLRCWLGIRLLLSVTLSTVSLYLNFPHNVFMVVTVLTGFLYIQTILRPYRGIGINTADTFLITNLIVLLLGLLFFNTTQYNQHETELPSTSIIFTSTVVSLAYVVFIAILLYHFFLRLPSDSQQTIKTRLEGSTIVQKMTQFITQNETGVTQEPCKHDPDDYHQFRDEDSEEKETEFTGITQSLVEGPQNSEGCAEITPVYT